MLYTYAKSYKELHMAAKDQQLEHAIQSIGKSVLVIGGFYTVLTILVLIVVAFDSTVVQQDSRGLLYGTILTVALSLFWILMGIRIRRSAPKPKEALKPIRIVMVVSIAYFFLNVFETVLAGPNLGIAITTIFAIYITWSYYDIKSRIEAKKKKS